jgi:hypothetical protein
MEHLTMTHVLNTARRRYPKYFATDEAEGDRLLQILRKSLTPAEMKRLIAELTKAAAEDDPEPRRSAETPAPTVDDIPENGIKKFAGDARSAKSRAAFDSMFPAARRIDSAPGYVEPKGEPAFKSAPRAEHLENFAKMFPNASKIG